jgi:hypothetical protein
MDFESTGAPLKPTRERYNALMVLLRERYNALMVLLRERYLFWAVVELLR